MREYALNFIQREGFCMTLRGIGFLSTLLAAVGTSVSVAEDYPYRRHKEQSIDRNQFGWIDLSIDAQGHGNLKHNWSNGKKTSGNTFYSVVVLTDKDGKAIYSDRQTKGLDGSWGGRAREGHVRTEFTLKAEQRDAIYDVLLKMGVMNCGLKLDAFHCCDRGIEVSFTPKKCDATRGVRRGR